MFKGGTTLSKVYGCIDGMSEEIDLSFDMNSWVHESATAASKSVAMLNEATQVAAIVMVPFLRDELAEINSSFEDQ